MRAFRSRTDCTRRRGHSISVAVVCEASARMRPPICTTCWSGGRIPPSHAFQHRDPSARSSRTGRGGLVAPFGWPDSTSSQTGRRFVGSSGADGGGPAGGGGLPVGTSRSPGARPDGAPWPASSPAEEAFWALSSASGMGGLVGADVVSLPAQAARDNDRLPDKTVTTERWRRDMAISQRRNVTRSSSTGSVPVESPARAHAHPPECFRGGWS